MPGQGREKLFKSHRMGEAPALISTRSDLAYLTHVSVLVTLIDNKVQEFF